MASIPRRYIVLAVLAVLIGGAASYVYFSRSNEDKVIDSEGTTKGYLVTDMEIPLIDGGALRFSDYEGKTLIIDFMAPWCSPCIEQIKILGELSDDPDVEIVSVNIDPNYNSSYLQRFAEEEGITWSFGSSTDAAVTYQTNAIPTILLVDKKGVIRYRGFFTPLNHFQQLLQQYG
ncbi:TlpA family protein disulfide reductase [Candidatus Bathyarchaeota archaeon]|nr:TlpA family protein disulfide reductase [Candidatus Bathyarchaeota archaeon]